MPMFVANSFAILSVVAIAIVDMLLIMANLFVMLAGIYHPFVLFGLWSVALVISVLTLPILERTCQSIIKPAIAMKVRASNIVNFFLVLLGWIFSIITASVVIYAEAYWTEDSNTDDNLIVVDQETAYIQYPSPLMFVIALLLFPSMIDLLWYLAIDIQGSSTNKTK